MGGIYFGYTVHVADIHMHAMCILPICATNEG